MQPPGGGYRGWHRRCDVIHVGDPVRRPVGFYEPDEIEPLVTAAVMYYQAHRSPEQIARHLGVSRPTP